MFRKGWYILESSDDTKIGTKYNVLLQEYQDLSV
jgi:hypothetical protein